MMDYPDPIGVVCFAIIFVFIKKNCADEANIRGHRAGKITISALQNKF